MEVSREWWDFRKGDYWETNALSVKLLPHICHGRLFGLGYDQVGKCSIPTDCCDFIECGEFNYPSFRRLMQSSDSQVRKKEEILKTKQNKTNPYY